jgi:hypothetical protein
MKAGIIRAIVDELVGHFRAKFAELEHRLEAIGLPEKGEPGPAGNGIKAITQTEDWITLGFEFDNGETIDVKLPPGPRGYKGDPGDKGVPGDPGAAADAAQVAAVLKASPDFLEAVLPAGPRATTWRAGIYRQGAEVLHHMGRNYAAIRDTTDEPGDSADWLRIGTGGMRHTGGYKDTRSYEPGDLYTKDGSTFVYDGARHWLMAPRPYTAADAEKASKATTAELREIHRELAALSRAIDDTRVVAQTAAERHLNGSAP